MTSITIPDSVTSIGDFAFSGCTGLTDVWYTGSEAERSAITLVSNNSALLAATWHYNTCPDEHTYSDERDGSCNLCEWTRKPTTTTTTTNAPAATQPRDNTNVDTDAEPTITTTTNAPTAMQPNNNTNADTDAEPTTTTTNAPTATQPSDNTDTDADTDAEPLPWGIIVGIAAAVIIGAVVVIIIIKKKK